MVHTSTCLPLLQFCSLWIRQCSAYAGIQNMKILNVAEKNDAAKHLAGYLSGGNIRRREGFSKWNKIYEFDCLFRGQKREMIMTSVSGHLLNLEFVGNYRKWHGCSPIALFDAPVIKGCLPDYEQIKRTLEREVRRCDMLIIWTDCDREGENIGFEVISVCMAIRPQLKVLRAKFSEITAQSVRRAMDTLTEPDVRISNAVDVRQELDLRIGASFTRFQTLRLQRVFPQKLADSLVSYGSCQFPTLGFVVERYKAVNSFVPEQFWKIKVVHTICDVSVEFAWVRGRLFDERFCQILFQRCLTNPIATVTNIVSKPKSKWRPTPLDTVELEKLGSRKLRLNAKETMRIAEKLYTQGFISYPRTETNIFPREINLMNLVHLQVDDRNWGAFASRVLQDGPNPRQGKKTDQAHPPIHPTKYSNSLHGDEQRVYELVVRHFLACLSKDAQGHETVVDIDINAEQFTASGLMILARNYLDVYVYEKWNAKEIHVYELGQSFQPTLLEKVDGETSPPNLLTEADLIALMEKHGIGTDATHADHIETIKTRLYVGLDGIYFVPGQLGIGLVDGYDSMGFAMSKPHLRADLEADLKRICEGSKEPQVVLTEQINKYRDVFLIATQQAEKIDAALGRYLEAEPEQVGAEEPLQATHPPTVMKCPACGLDMVVKPRANGAFFITCLGYPQCNRALWFPTNVLAADVTAEHCPECGPDVKLVKLRFRAGSMTPHYPNVYTACVNGCDANLLEMLDIRPLVADNRQTVGHDASVTLNGVASMNVPLSQRIVTNGSATNSSGYQSGSSHLSAATFGSNSHSSWGPPPNQLPRWPPQRSDSDNTAAGDAYRNQMLNKATTKPLSHASNQDVFVIDDDGVRCQCGVPAKKLTVMKESVNKGRQFYACSKSQAERCDYFLWADAVPSPLATGNNGNTGQTRQQPWSASNTSLQQGSIHLTGAGSSADVCCECGQSARRLTVMKESVNKGRPFYTCAKPRDQACKFFMWGDEDSVGGGVGGGIAYQPSEFRGRGWGDGGSSSSTSDRGHNKAARGASQGMKTPRKCSQCGQEGHNKRNCPHV